jgi:cobalt-zinc-cadmium efflux system protein
MHTHSHVPRMGRVLRWSMVATTLFVAVEAAAGIHAGSLALLSDAGHNLTDAVALLLAWFACYMQERPATDTKTFGYHRTGVLAAFLNAIVLLALSAWIFYESYQRLLRPEPVAEWTMIWVASFGLLLNAGIMWGLRVARHSDINIRSAFVHMLGDALGSIAIVIGALIIHGTGWYQVDPILSIIIGALVIYTAWDIVKESLNILLEGLPKDIQLHDVTSAMGDVDGVIDVHDLHIWSLGSSTHALSCHVLIEDVPPSRSNRILEQLNCVLADRFDIHHSTVQFEHVGCALSENGCSIPAGTETHRHSDH